MRVPRLPAWSRQLTIRRSQPASCPRGISRPGFMNFTLGQSWYEKAVRDVFERGADYGRSQTDKPEKVMVEFVSANPTGPMHMGNARGGVLGDCLSSVLDWSGNDVTREFYINDAGNQVDKFAHSVEGRYIQEIRGEDAIEFDPSRYQGDDIKALAHDLVEQYGDSLMDKTPEERFAIIEGYGLPTNIARMERDLGRYKISYDVWFRESELHESGYVKETIDMLTAKGATYETEDGALWLRSTDFGCDKDDVLRRANGFYTYFAADIAYHRNKFEKRGFDRVINIWGADHHGHVKRLQCALDALGLDGSHRLVVVLMQLVNLMQDGKPVRMSKRSGKAIALHDLLDEISVDAARYFFNSRASTSPLDFDLDLAVREDSENPIYYVEYAHARICSILKKLESDGVVFGGEEGVNPALLTEPAEDELIRMLAAFPQEIVMAAEKYDPSRINRFVIDLAGAFHHFYGSCRIQGAEPALQQARIALCIGVRNVIRSVLTMFKINVPEKM